MSFFFFSFIRAVTVDINHQRAGFQIMNLRNEISVLIWKFEHLEKEQTVYLVCYKLLYTSVDPPFSAFWLDLI